MSLARKPRAVKCSGGAGRDAAEGGGGVRPESGPRLSRDHDRRGIGVRADDLRMIEASAIRRPRSPCTRSSESTTARSSLPILHVPTACMSTGVARTWHEIGVVLHVDPGASSLRAAPQRPAGRRSRARAEPGATPLAVVLRRIDFGRRAARRTRSTTAAVQSRCSRAGGSRRAP